MAEVGAGDGIIVGVGGPLGMGGTGGGPIMYMFRQHGVAGYGPVSFGGENISSIFNFTGQSSTALSHFFDGIKGAYNANINQASVNAITEIGPSQSGNNTILPYVLYGMSGYTPSPLIFNVSLHEFLDEREGVGGLVTSISDRRSTDDSFGGFISSGMSNNSTTPLLQNSGPSKLSEIMDSVPHDPFVQQGGQGSSTNNTGPGNAGINLPLGTANFILSGMYSGLM